MLGPLFYERADSVEIPQTVIIIECRMMLS
jgi:hypothetical protein